MPASCRAASGCDWRATRCSPSRRRPSSTPAASRSCTRRRYPNTFDGVLVELGPKLTDADGVAYYPVLAGLVPGDAVAVGGAFLIDAETRLNPAAGSIYIGGSRGREGGAAGPPEHPGGHRRQGDRRPGQAAARGPGPGGGPEVLPGPAREPPRRRWACRSRSSSTGSQCSSAAKGASTEAQAEPAKFRRERPRSCGPRGRPAPAAPKPSKQEEKIRVALSKLSPADRALAEAQRFAR